MNRPTCKSTAKRLAVQRTRIAPSEHEEQVALMQWAFANRKRVPALESLFAIANGGARHPAVAGKLKTEGVKPGVPDLLLAIGRELANGNWSNGLFIEMKKRKFSPSDVKPEQREWHERLQKANYMVKVCGGFEEARTAICGYLGVQP